MSKGRQRSNREPKKPKQAKPKVAATAITPPILQPKPMAFGRGKKR